MEHFPISLGLSRGGYGLLAKRPPSTGVIFVHGFQGNPRSTWIDFQSLVEEIGSHRPFWSEADLFFYAYRSRDQIRPLAEDFARFLTGVAVAKETMVTSVDYVLPSSENHILGVPADISGLRGSKPYTNLILVGHSTGGVIIREAIRLIIIGNPEAEINALIANSRLRLFAPAHLGVLAAGKLGLAQSLPVLDRIFGAYLRSNPLYQNLGPSSPTILDLKKSTEQLHTERKLPALKASSLFGKHEEVVVIGEYSHDDVIPTEPAHGHVSICKPTADYLKPLEFVTNGVAIAKSA